MLSDYSKKSVAGNIFTNCLNEIRNVSSKHIVRDHVTTWETFISSAEQDFHFIVDKCKFVYESFPMLSNDPHYVDIVDRLNNWTPLTLFQLYGQPESRPSYFFFDKFRYQTKEEVEISNKRILDIFAELNSK